MKAIIIGASLSGKTTIIKKLRGSCGYPISEMDEELTNLNGGEYPSDSNYKNKVLIPKVVERVLNKEEILFFTNTDCFNLDDLQRAKSKGFRIIQIDVNYKELLKRNTERVKNEGYGDSSVWLKGMLKYQKNIREKGLVDELIDGGEPVSQIVRQLRMILKV